MPLTGRQVCGVVCIAVAFCAGSAAQVPTISLKAVQVNTRITNPASTVDALRNDIIVAEIKLAHWSPNGEALRGYQVAIDESSFESGDTGAVRALGSQHTCPAEPCVLDADCGVDLYCLSDGCCYGPNALPGQGAFISETRFDYVFFGWQTWGVVDTLNYRYGQTLARESDCPTYSFPEKYGGTLILEVTADASGTFTISPLPFMGSQLLGCDVNVTRITPIQVQPLIVRVPPLERLVVESDPPDCSVVARQPTDPTGAEVMTRDSIALRFDPPATSDLEPADFSVREDPVVGDPLDIVSVTPSVPEFGWATLTLSRPLTLGTWTCVTYLLDPPVEVCTAQLPGDVDGSGVVEGADVVTLVDHMNGSLDPPLGITSCDIDRSGRCGPADLLRMMDLLGGAEFFSPWLGQTIPSCPSAAQAPIDGP